MDRLFEKNKIVVGLNPDVKPSRANQVILRKPPDVETPIEMPPPLTPHVHPVVAPNHRGVHAFFRGGDRGDDRQADRRPTASDRGG
jgi:hypothetical protein